MDERPQGGSAELTPTPTAAPPTSTPVPEPAPVVPSMATPASMLGDQYFGQVFLTIVPGPSGVATPMVQFWNQDQIGLYVERLYQPLRMPFDVRLFEVYSRPLLQDTRADAVPR